MIGPSGTGNVGIGETNPTSALHIKKDSVNDSDARWNLALIDPSTMAAGIGGGISFGGETGTGVVTSWSSIKGIKENANSGDYAGALSFVTRVNGGSLTERMRITSDGNVGIGTTSPDIMAKLHVKGNDAAGVDVADFGDERPTIQIE